MENSENSFTKKLRCHKIVGFLITVIKSAAVGLLFAVLCFAYDVYHDSEQDAQLEASIDKLAKIEQSLSTRYLGIFPEYIEEIGRLFDNITPTDTIVIFEDVLYYGIKSRPKEFYNMHKKLFEHAMNGGSVTVAYYNFIKSNQTPLFKDIFHKMIKESRISSNYHAIMNERYVNEINKLQEAKQRIEPEVFAKIDSLLCEEYFEATKRDDTDKFKKDIDAYLSKELVSNMDPNSSAAEYVTNQMCEEIDNVKQHYLGHGKTIDDISFSDYEMMYRDISQVIVSYYTKFNIELVPLEEYLTMSCWLVKGGNRKEVKTVLAFPSKYSTDEIGFYSQDEAFSRYIGTMLDGVKRNNRWKQNE